MHVHHHMDIRDLKFQVSSLVKWTMAPSRISTGFLPLFFFSLLFVQSALVMAKRVRLDEIVGVLGEKKEEEPEGEELGNDSTGN